jgi:hypothetical protein
MTTAAAEGTGNIGLITLDGPTVWAAGTTILFTVGTAMALGLMPASGPLAAAVDALKNLVYVLSIPVFDVSRRLLARRRVARTHIATVASSRNLFFVVFVSALILFVVTEIVSFLVGYGLGYICGTIATATKDIKSGDCFRFSLETMSVVLILPVMLAIGIACGWIWFRMLRGRFWSALLICAVFLGVLFAIDLVWAFRSPDAEILGPMLEQVRNLGFATQVGKQIVILTVAILVGYMVALFWSGVARWIG